MMVCVPLVAACAAEQPVDMKKILSQPQQFVGANTCKLCHLEHYDSWKETMHSRMSQNVDTNKDAIVVSLDAKKIREDLSGHSDSLEGAVDQIYIPSLDDVKIVIGSEWKQRYIVHKDGDYFIAPVEYNSLSGRWGTYHAKDWDKRSWIVQCAGCHATGVDIEKKTFSELGVSCEACHGKGSWHTALPKTAVFEKRQTIINPAKLTTGLAAQICGSCHTRGQATMSPKAEWAAGFTPGTALQAYYRWDDHPGKDRGQVKTYYAEEFSMGHHQQFNDWAQSTHFSEGVTCTSCHYVHQLGIALTGSQTKAAGSEQCFECHRILNKTTGHAIHSFANCVGCHMPKIAKSEESGTNHSHVFVALVPKDTIDNPALPNSCQVCHAHKGVDLREFQEKAFPGSMDEW